MLYTLSLHDALPIYAVQFAPGVVDAVGERPEGADRENPEHRGHTVGEDAVGRWVRRERADDEQHDAFGPSEETNVALRYQALGARRGVRDEHGADHRESGEQNV